MRGVAIWAGVALAVVGPVLGAASSPLLAWRDPVYIAAGLSGVVGMGLLLLQPALALGLLPGLGTGRARRMHRICGLLVLGCVLAHVIGLWVTSPPDVLDVLLFRSPTSFSIWGVIAMWALLATAPLALTWRRIGLRFPVWARLHRALGACIAVLTVLHVAPIDGAMDAVSKVGLSGLLLWAAIVVLARSRPKLR